MVEFLNIPEGLPATTSDKLAKLARLITAGVDLPFAARVTNKVLPGHLDAKYRQPILVEQGLPPTPNQN